MAIGLFELAGEVRGWCDIAGAPDARAAAFAMGDQHGITQPRFDRRSGVADMDHKRAAADRSANIIPPCRQRAAARCRQRLGIDPYRQF